MPVTLVNLTGFQRGVELDEVGINVKSFEAAYKPEYKEFVHDKKNLKRGFAVADPEADITVEGEVCGAAGLMAATFNAAVVLANDTDEFGLSDGDIFMDSVTIKQARDGWRDASFKFSRNMGVTAAAA